MWSYEITSTACCGELADALAEQHFSPFHKSFKWFVFDEGGTEFPREKTLDECGVREGAVLILRMVCSAPPLDPARLREPNALFYANHELECTADFSDAIRKMEKIVQTERWNTEVLNNLACVYLEANQNISRAKELVGLYLGSEPDAKDAAWFQDTIGWLEYRNGNWLKAEDFLRKSLRGTNRWEDREGYNETLYHLYFAWRRLKKDTAAGFARDELLAWLSTYGRPQLFAKRIELDDDSYLLPTDSYLGERRLHALGISRHGQWELISAA